MRKKNDDSPPDISQLVTTRLRLREPHAERFERTQEIGLLKALGMRRRGITLMDVVEAASIGFWGGITGVGAASLLARALNPILSRTLFKGLGRAITLSYPLPYMAAIIGGAKVIGLLAGTLAAIRAGKLEPIAALRSNESL